MTFCRFVIGFSFSFFWLVTGSRVTTSECEESGCTVSHNASEEVAAQISADEASAQVSALGDAAQLRSIKMHSDSSVKLSFLSDRNHVRGDLLILLNFVKIHITINLARHGVKLTHVALILFNAG